MKITIDSKWCKGCALCVRACKKGVLAIGEQRSSGGLHRLQDVRADLPRCLHRGHQGIRGGQNHA